MTPEFSRVHIRVHISGGVGCRILAELDHTEGVQLLKVPMSDVMWSTWKRYCEAIGLTMGYAIAALIGHELRTVVGDADGGDPVFVGRADTAADGS